MAKAYLSLGTNMKDKRANLESALVGLQNQSQIDIQQVSSVYETEPIGYVEQDVFLNIVVEITTSLTPHELLTFCLALEKEIGRVRLFKWGPRLIDIDILLYDNQTIQTEDLSIPHPFMRERAFVILPLLEIAPNLAYLVENKEVLAEQGIKKTAILLNW